MQRQQQGGRIWRCFPVVTLVWAPLILLLECCLDLCCDDALHRCVAVQRVHIIIAQVQPVEETQQGTHSLTAMLTV
jgi:hypothetical protein